MLEFMVLGEIPGTQIQFNFTDVLLVSAWILVFLEAFIVIQRHRYNVAVAKMQNAKNSKKISTKGGSMTKKPSQKNRKISKNTASLVTKSATS